MSKIKLIKGRQVFDSRGNPTVEAEVYSDSGLQASAIVPSGASTGSYEAFELRDKENKEYLGKSVLKALEKVIGQKISSEEMENCSEVDGKTSCERNQFFFSSFDGEITKLRISIYVNSGTNIENTEIVKDLKDRIDDVSNQLFLQFTKSLSSKLEGNDSDSTIKNDDENSLSGVSVASAALKGVSGRLMDKIRGGKDTE